MSEHASSFEVTVSENAFNPQHLTAEAVERIHLPLRGHLTCVCFREDAEPCQLPQSV